MNDEDKFKEVKQSGNSKCLWLRLPLHFSQRSWHTEKAPRREVRPGLCVQVMLVRMRGAGEPGAGWQCRKAMDPGRHRASLRQGCQTQRCCVGTISALRQIITHQGQQGNCTLAHHRGTPECLSLYWGAQELLQGNLCRVNAPEPPLLSLKWVLRSLCLCS